jgi:hypothetical protein
MEKEYEIFISPSGDVHFVYYDELKPLLELGKPSIERISHVDAFIVDDSIVWFADLSPINGPKLGPCNNRDEAIEAELKWISDNLHMLLK